MTLLHQLLITIALLIKCSTNHQLMTNVININLDSQYRLVDEDFLSVTIDAGSIRYNWSDINFTDTKVINMAKALSPVTLRLGGTSADLLLFDPNKISDDSVDDFTMSPSQWDAINEFVKTVNWRFIFGLNLHLQYSNGTWNSTNAEEILDYTMKQRYQVGWELGNEPDKANISSEQIIDAFFKLHSILDKKQYSFKWYTAGPDVASVTRNDIMRDFLEAAKSNPDLINAAATWHNYYENSETVQIYDFYSVKVLDKLLDTIQDLLQVVKESSYSGDLWLGETSSTYGGGRVLYSECYVSGFMWLDKLGITAYTQNKVFRQDFVGGHYALLDRKQNPLPDYWLSLLYKKLVSNRVLEVKGALEKGRSVRIYAHCALNQYPRGSVVLIALNTNNETIAATLTDKQLQESERDIYWLTAANNLTSQ